MTMSRAVEHPRRAVDLGAVDADAAEDFGDLFPRDHCYIYLNRYGSIEDTITQLPLASVSGVNRHWRSRSIFSYLNAPCGIEHKDSSP